MSAKKDKKDKTPKEAASQGTLKEIVQGVTKKTLSTLDVEGAVSYADR